MFWSSVVVIQEMTVWELLSVWVPKSVIQFRDDAEAASGKNTIQPMAAVAQSPQKQTMARKKLSQYSDMIHEYTRLLLQNLSKIKTEMSARQNSQN